MKSIATLLILASIATIDASPDNESSLNTVLKQAAATRVTSGPLRGRLVTTKAGNKGYAFLNIPYAMPPVGNLRFEKTVPLPDRPLWSEPRNSTEYGANCYSVNWYGENITNYSEDCLTANVFSGKRCMLGLTKCPVLYYYIGGSWMFGAPSTFPVDTMIDHWASKDMVYVTVNFRTNAFSFLNTPDGSLDGNLALWDGIEGLKWVQKEISNFGGDPDRVTMMGHSSGASGISLFSLIPETEGLYHQAVVMSSSAFEFDPISYVRKDPSENVARNLNCTPDDFDWSPKSTQWPEVVECLKSVSPENIVDVQFKDLQIFSPKFDNDLLPAFPHQLSTTRRPVPYLIGITSNETGYAKSLKTDNLEKALYPMCLTTLIGNQPQNVHLRHMIASACVKYYAKVYNNNTRLAYSMLSDDATKTLATLKDAQTMAENGGKVFLYQFDYKKDGYGFAHAQDLNFLMGINIANLTSDYTEDDNEMAKIYIAYFVNFVKYGNPTPENDDWEPLTDIDNYYSISLNSSMKAPFARVGNTFWNSVVPGIIDGATIAAKSKGQLLAKDISPPAWFNSTAAARKVKAQLDEIGHQIVSDLQPEDQALRAQIFAVIDSTVSDGSIGDRIDQVAQAVMARHDRASSLREGVQQLLKSMQALVDGAIAGAEQREESVKDAIDAVIMKMRHAIHNSQMEADTLEAEVKSIYNELQNKTDLKQEQIDRVEQKLQEVADKLNLHLPDRPSIGAAGNLTQQLQDVWSAIMKRHDMASTRRENIQTILKAIMAKVANITSAVEQREETIKQAVDSAIQGLRHQIHNSQMQADNIEEQLRSIGARWRARQAAANAIERARIESIVDQIEAKVRRRRIASAMERAAALRDEVQSAMEHVRDAIQKKVEQAVEARKEATQQAIEEERQREADVQKMLEDARDAIVERREKRIADIRSAVASVIERIRSAIADKLEQRVALQALADQLRARIAERRLDQAIAAQELLRAIVERLDEEIQSAIEEKQQREAGVKHKLGGSQDIDSIIDHLGEIDDDRLEDIRDALRQRAEQWGDRNETIDDIKSRLDDWRDKRDEIVDDLADRADDIRQKMKDRQEAVEQKKNETKQEIKEKLKDKLGKAREAEEEAWKKQNETRQEIKEKIKEKIDEAREADKEAWQKRNETIEKIRDAIEKVASRINETVQSTKSDLQSANKDWQSAIDAIRQSIVESIGEAVNATIDRNKKIADIRNETIGELVDDRRAVIEQLNDTIADIKQKIRDRLSEEAKKRNATKEEIDEKLNDVKDRIKQSIKDRLTEAGVNKVDIEVAIRERLRQIRKALDQRIFDIKWGRRSLNETLDDIVDDLRRAVDDRNATIGKWRDERQAALEDMRDEIVEQLRIENGDEVMKDRIDEIRCRIESINETRASDWQRVKQWHDENNRLFQLPSFADKDILPYIKQFPLPPDWIKTVEGTIKDARKQVADYKATHATQPRTLNLAAASASSVGINYQIGFYVVTAMLCVVIVGLVIYAGKVAVRGRSRVVNERSPLIVDSKNREI